MIPIHAYEGRRVAVFGLGRTGIATAKALEAGGAAVSCWDDAEPSRVRAQAEGLTLDDLNRRDWGDIAALVLSPGIPLTHPKPHRVVELARAVDAPVIGDIELFAMAIADLPDKRRPKVIGITGTNGKSTTTALIGHILRETGRNVVVGGNIGDAILAQAPPRPGSYYVLELSSYQIDLTQTLACDVAVLLNVSPDHIDRHGDFQGYLRAKQRLFSMQQPGGVAVIGIDDNETSAFYSSLRQERREEEVIPISAGRVFARGVYALGDRVYDALDCASHPVVDLVKSPSLPGRHNAQNAAAALAVVRALGVAGRAAADAIASFPGLAHRQERIATINGITYINDSKATNAEAAVQALGCYERVRWIVGGRAKEGGLAAARSQFHRVEKAYLIGEAAERFARELDGNIACELCGDLAGALTAATRDAGADPAPGQIILLSPAAASFDQFTSYEARGDTFRELVGTLVPAVAVAEGVA
ncbi:UDP-N-acetylmuramoylalanine--D-glutamate ligase [Maricaulis sp. W15]|uniref:UDP-N-acetylmuramoyl-L-alanine--D-glutamate ligase n=1 Tax=Maricaulis sp. W15 TaxID=1772333 RepID=UPI0009489D51|nr:UDP-N-acetylmuramoyl-L-alanine--D-glutamate ligase [Maricaulis sp. W15]OLF73927.1 UDP-N-acetylmuramoylalanine--D-glutamate ligase [Maricaulis sp. W15]